MQPLILDSLVGVPLTIEVSVRLGPFRPAAMFELPVILSNIGEEAVQWSQERLLNLAYRWLTQDGVAVEREGMRTALPVGSLLPGSRLEIEIVGVAPDEEGTYQLQLSLVLEGAHWACDVGSDGWTQLSVAVVPAPAWPVELLSSNGARAIRGAIAAAELAHRVTKRSIAGYLSEAAVVSVGAADLEDGALTSVQRAPERRGLGAWLRSMLGVSDLQNQVSDVLELAGRQEHQTRELEQQIVLLRNTLHTPAPPERNAAGSGRHRVISPGPGKRVPR